MKMIQLNWHEQEAAESCLLFGATCCKANANGLDTEPESALEAWSQLAGALDTLAKTVYQAGRLWSVATICQSGCARRLEKVIRALARH